MARNGRDFHCLHNCSMKRLRFPPFVSLLTPSVDSSVKMVDGQLDGHLLAAGLVMTSYTLTHDS